VVAAVSGERSLRLPGAGAVACAPRLAGSHGRRTDRIGEDFKGAISGTPGTGTVNYLASVLFAQQAGVQVQQIIEKGSNPLITDMMGGFVKVGFNPIPVSRPALDGGYVRALAVTSSKHSSLMPDLPTLAEAGLLGFDATLTYGLLAPADTPGAIVDRLNKELRSALASDEVRARIIAEGGEP
jgi:tripartite-type tricarboxylate transporter receptor subunit TctC